MPSKKETAIVPVTTELAALRDFEGLAEIVKANMGESAAAPLSALETIKVPSGGAPVYVTENEVDGIQAINEFEAIICWHRDTRTWWSTSIEEGGGGRPACESHDLKTGRGDNGTWTEESAAKHNEANPDNPVEVRYSEDGTPEFLASYECAKCPQNRWGENPKEDDGNYCSEGKPMFLLRMDKPDVIFPSILRAPPTSLRPIRRYMMALAARGVPFFGALHKFSLEPATNARGIDYSTIKVSFVRKLEPDEIAAVKGYAQTMKETFEGAATS